MVLRSLHPPLSSAWLVEMRRHLGDLTASLTQLQTDATALLSAQYEEARCRDHVGQKCRLCPPEGPLSAAARVDAARTARVSLRLMMAAQIIDVFHAADPDLSVDELMSIIGDAWVALQETGREAGR